MAEHFMIMQGFLEPWARKHGAGPDWKNEIIDDLAGRARDEIRYVPAPSSEVRPIPSINIIGERYVVRAARDGRYDDTLFLVQINPIGKRGAYNNLEPVRVIKARWSLWNRAPGTPIDIPELAKPVPAPPSSRGLISRRIGQTSDPSGELTRRVESILRDDDGEWLSSIPLEDSADVKALLARMRRCHTSYRPLVVAGPATPLLVGSVNPSSIDERVEAAREALGFPLLEACVQRSSEEFRACLLSLLAIPPPPRVLRWLVECWLRVAPPERLAARARVLAAIVDHGPEDLPWAREPLATVAATTTLATEPLVTETTAAGADTLASVSGTASQGSTSSARPASAAEGLVAGRLRELRYQQALSEGGGTTETRALREAADAIPARIERVKDAASARALLDTVTTVLELAGKMATTLAPLTSSAVEDDVARAVADWRSRPDWTEAAAWLADVHSWSDAQDLLALVADEGVAAIPSWVWRLLAPSEMSRAESAYRALLRAETRAEVRQAAAWVRTLPDTERRHLAASTGGDGENVRAMLAAAVSAGARVEGARARCSEIAARIGPWAARLAESSEDQSPIEREASLQSIDGDLEALRKRCEKRIIEELDAILHDSADLQAAHLVIRELLADTDVLGEDTADYVSVRAIRKNAALRRSPAPLPPNPPQAVASKAATDDAIRFEIDHCLSVDSNVRTAPLYLRESENVIVTDVPFDVRVERPVAVTVTVTTTFAHLRNRKILDERVRPRTLELTVDDWEERAGKGWFGHTIILEGVPIAPLRADGKLLTADNSSIEKVSVKIEVNGTTKELSFPQLHLATKLPNVLFAPFAETTKREEMEIHPLGLQTQFKRLADEMRAGAASLLVAAPRRFGKTTLLRSLCEELASSDDVVVPAFVTSGVNPSGNTKLEEHEIVRSAFVWACKNLGEKLDLHIDTDWAGDLPPLATFDRAREKAASTKKKAVYLLFDEAQALFRGVNGRQVAEMLKARIETNWGLASPGRAPIRFGLFGQLHLPRLIKGQLDALFGKPRITSEISEEDLRQFLAARAENVLSNASARWLLARQSQSFFVLRSLIEELEDTLLREKHRAWFVKADVDEATRSLVDRVLGLPDAPIHSYLRDPLNGSDDLTEWKPVTSYPVALAWANVLARRIEPRPRRIDELVRLLGRWTETLVPDGAGLSILEERVQRALEELTDLGILRRDELFSSTMLQRLLEGLSETARPLASSEEVRALQSLTIDEVAWLPGAELVGEGGEAKVYRIAHEKGHRAIREADLTNEKKRSAFIQTCRVLKAIEGTRSRDPGYMSLPVVRDAGLRAGNPASGLVIYDWVRGADLVASVDSLADDVVADIGWSLAEALVVLETRRIVHRDIKPENVVIDELGRPVLIDFGLSRLNDYDSRTHVSSGREYLAPEVQKDPPHWSSKSDVFALSVLLRKLRRSDGSPKERAALDRVLAKGTESAESIRFSPRDLAVELKTLAEELAVNERRQQALAECRAGVEKLSQSAVKELGLQFAEYVAAARAGYHPPFARVRFAAAFLDSVFINWYVQHYVESERRVKHPYHLTSLQTGTHPELGNLPLVQLWITGNLRHAESHKESARAMQAASKLAKENLRADDEATLRSAVQTAADALQRVTQCQGLADVARSWIR